MNDNFKTLINNLTSTTFKDNTHSIALDDLKINLQRSINICEKSSDRVEMGEEQDYWFQILQQLYKMDQQIKEKIIDSRRGYFKEINDTISRDIRELLEKMCSYVSIQAIITVINPLYTENMISWFLFKIASPIEGNFMLSSLIFLISHEFPSYFPCFLEFPYFSWISLVLMIFYII